ncbi:MoaD/ThiS family protein [Parasphingorhabdus sp.]|uniref:MoaD/ThiS family protein n=1 Tax=Parasphingorhabdus sp. TaxID=2709688 RepID=UPI003A8D361E
MENFKEANITVELCGQLATILADQITIRIAENGSNIAKVRHEIAIKYPEMAVYMASPRVKACLDETIVLDSAAIMPNQILAFFPPVSGG